MLLLGDLGVGHLSLELRDLNKYLRGTFPGNFARVFLVSYYIVGKKNSDNVLTGSMLFQLEGLPQFSDMPAT